MLLNQDQQEQTAEEKERTFQNLIQHTIDIVYHHITVNYNITS
jgi:hypothetical protein